MYWHNLTSKTIGIWGMGKEGTAVLSALKKFTQPAQIICIDETNLNHLQQCDIVIKSPGVSLYRNEIIEAKKQGVIFTSGSSLFMANKPQSTHVIGITGTKGKSTTSSLLYHTLKAAGLNVAFGGNIGKPLVELLKDESQDIIVAELSSYQCADFIGSCDTAILTNLFPEHLQWHVTHDQYYKDKCKMVSRAKTAFVNTKNAIVKQYLSQLPKAEFFNTSDTIHIENGYFWNGNQVLFPLDALNLVGQHNAENACAVLSVALRLGLSNNIIQSAFQTFNALPHRLQTIGTFKGITYIDDSISTTPETAVAAVKAFDKGVFITLIIGGLDRGQNFNTLIDFLKPMKNRIHLITMPDTGTRAFEAAVTAGISATSVDTMEQAVKCAKQVTPLDGTVILSPASPSYNRYKNFEERGADFARWINS